MLRSLTFGALVVFAIAAIDAEQFGVYSGAPLDSFGLLAIRGGAATCWVNGTPNCEATSLECLSCEGAVDGTDCGAAATKFSYTNVKTNYRDTFSLPANGGDSNTNLGDIYCRNKKTCRLCATDPTSALKYCNTTNQVDSNKHTEYQKAGTCVYTSS